MATRLPLIATDAPKTVLASGAGLFSVAAGIVGVLLPKSYT